MPFYVSGRLQFRKLEEWIRGKSKQLEGDIEQRTSGISKTRSSETSYILDILLTANEYNLGEKTTKKWGKILKLVNYMNKDCPNAPWNIDRAFSDLALRFGAKGGLSQREMKWAYKAVQSRQSDFFNFYPTPANEPALQTWALCILQIFTTKQIPLPRT